jgi:hypothetical protein
MVNVSEKCCTSNLWEHMRGARVFVHHLRCLSWSRVVPLLWGSPFKGGVSGRDERVSAFLCAFAPHPPNPLLPLWEKGEFGGPADMVRTDAASG